MAFQLNLYQQLSLIKWAIQTSQYTATHRIYLNPRPAAEPAAHVHGRHGGHPHQQWSGTQYFTNNQSSDVIGHRGRTGRIVHQRQNGTFNATHTQGNGTSANLHPHPNHQFNCAGTTHKQNYAQGDKGHGHAIPLVALPQSSGPVSILLETWNTESGGLLDQASSSQQPQIILATNSNVHHSWYQEHNIQYSKEYCDQVLCQEYSICENMWHSYLALDINSPR